MSDSDGGGSPLSPSYDVGTPTSQALPKDHRPLR